MKKKEIKKPNYLAIALVISVLLNFYLYYNANFVQNYEEPLVVQNMGKKYRELLEDNSEEVAQQKLIEYLKTDETITKAEIRINQNPGLPGLQWEYCGPTKGAGGNSWYNLETVR